MALYDSIGRGYSKTRAPDERITRRLVELLNLPEGALVLDVGAGTGKYSSALAGHGYRMIALEPSVVMETQGRRVEGVEFMRASAENIPLPDDTVAGAIVVLALHHFEQRTRALGEILRVAGDGPVVIFTFDPVAIRSFWLSEYFPHLGRCFRSCSMLAEVLDDLRTLTTRTLRSVAFPLPPDLQDRFGAASWAKPEAYLDAEVRNGISDFALMDELEVQTGVQRLAADLQSGVWDARHGELRTSDHYHVGYYFIVILPRIMILRK